MNTLLTAEGAESAESFLDRIAGLTQTYFAAEGAENAEKNSHEFLRHFDYAQYKQAQDR